MTFRQLYILMKNMLESASDSPATEALLLLSKAGNMTKEQILLLFEDEVPYSISEEAFKLAESRASGIPLQYITGKCYFYGLELSVEEGVFIPRVETEVLVDIALDIIGKNKLSTVLDIGTGSGAIALAIALNTNCKVYASDISKKALSTAMKNAADYAAKIEFFRGAFLTPVKHIINEIQLIVSNPPYIPVSSKLPKDVIHEPHEALFAGNDGLDFYRQIFSEPDLLKNKILIMEFSPDQKEEIQKICNYFGKISFFKDQFGKIRFFSLIVQ
ncbi:peptide chain release factor N(5)-glutamine methyltransferase [Pseudothermotoga elfii]|uniref:peptide chain release factor N(5)-glutamine methyltransferase n=1 Tax=Pseudothermotoga elfii TaxID=38322 RepID=UPI0004182FC1|nr:peptide chain release factor N(5)-glutamine methyltransferase [Pseudothermotoga elfii]